MEENKLPYLNSFEQSVNLIDFSLRSIENWDNDILILYNIPKFDTISCNMESISKELTLSFYHSSHNFRYALYLY